MASDGRAVIHLRAAIQSQTDELAAIRSAASTIVLRAAVAHRASLPLHLTLDRWRAACALIAAEASSISYVESELRSAADVARVRAELSAARADGEAVVTSLHAALEATQAEAAEASRSADARRALASREADDARRRLQLQAQTLTEGERERLRAARAHALQLLGRTVDAGARASAALGLARWRTAAAALVAAGDARAMYVAAAAAAAVNRAAQLERAAEACAIGAARGALRTWAAALARRAEAAGSEERTQLAADHEALSVQFHQLKRRFDSLSAERGRLVAEAEAREREVAHEASALRSALLSGRDGAHAAAASAASAAGGGSGGVGLPVEAELAALRRKLRDVGQDNALLSQNFVLLKARLTEVTAQKAKAEGEHQDGVAHVEATLQRRFGARMRAHHKLLASELAEVDTMMTRRTRRQRAFALSAALGGAHRADLRAFVGRWKTMTYAEGGRAQEAALERLSTAQQTALRRGGERLVAAERSCRSVRRAADLAAALGRWHEMLPKAALAAARADTATVAAEFAVLQQRLGEAKEAAEGERARAVAMSREAHDVAADMQRDREKLRTAEQLQYAAQNERDALAAKVAAAEATEARLQEQLRAVADERRRWESERATASRDKDALWRELQQAHGRMQQLQAGEGSTAVQAAEAVRERDSMRLRLQTVETARERERGLLQDSQYALQRLQAQLLVQQQVAGKAWQHGVPADTEKQMSFHADLLTFANKVETKPLWPHHRSSPPHHHI